MATITKLTLAQLHARQTSIKDWRQYLYLAVQQADQSLLCAPDSEGVIRLQYRNGAALSHRPGEPRYRDASLHFPGYLPPGEMREALAARRYAWEVNTAWEERNITMLAEEPLVIVVPELYKCDERDEKALLDVLIPSFCANHEIRARVLAWIDSISPNTRTQPNT